VSAGAVFTARASRLPTIAIAGPLAQLVEQGTFNPKVVGSIPTRPTFIHQESTLHRCARTRMRVPMRVPAGRKTVMATRRVSQAMARPSGECRSAQSRALEGATAGSRVEALGRGGAGGRGAGSGPSSGGRMARLRLRAQRRSRASLRASARSSRRSASCVIVWRGYTRTTKRGPPRDRNRSGPRGLRAYTYSRKTSSSFAASAFRVAASKWP
jgi:hypothetical protein